MAMSLFSFKSLQKYSTISILYQLFVFLTGIYSVIKHYEMEILIILQLSATPIVVTVLLIYILKKKHWAFLGLLIFNSGLYISVIISSRDFVHGYNILNTSLSAVGYIGILMYKPKSNVKEIKNQGTKPNQKGKNA